MAGYYRKFVRNFGHISKPLTNMLKKGELFIGTTTAEEAFQSLKQALISKPSLAMPYFTR